ncbi:DsrE family protein [Massilia endophytica]|uniref:DsrE family protein n=1 Tax=Massilia endophytica TaxID=2899220 RepID=UPI001E29C582|nr:DsrE family protein [Massilia endophytica]UGQ48769.1 DsrE family protein [Massilia endophytica]
MTFIRTMLLALLAFASFGAAAQQREEKVVYHVTDSSLATTALNNIRNHLKASPKVKIVVVANGAGIDFMLDGAKNSNGNPYDAAIEELSMHHKVEFRVCANTLEARHIDKNKVIPEAKIVPSGVAEAARLQLQEGYAYLKP